MLQDMPSFRWYRAFRITILVAAILLAVLAAAMVTWGGLFQIVLGDEASSSEFASIFYGLRTFFYQGVALLLLTDALFFVTFAILRRGSCLSVYFAYTLNVWLPMVCLLAIPIFTRYANVIISSLRTEVPELSSDLYGVSQAVNASIPLLCIINAVFFALLLLPNSVYFYKRRKLIHPGVAY